ncbi:hypothetical protein LCGC14_0364690 [marine sediment metagenome]|uniref:Uncharacterized protein n=1 Tax=marine sediment metagenome TaxID=412755 RepID=A0A0F9TPU3_9ZZZZ
MREKIRISDKSKVLSDVFGVFYTGTHKGENAVDNASVLTDMGNRRKLYPFLDEIVGKTIYNLTDGSSGVITGITNNTVTATLAGGTGDDWDLNDLYVIGERVLNVAIGGPPVPGASMPPPDGYDTIADGNKDVTVAGTREPLVGSATPCKKVDIQANGDNTDVIVIGANTCVAALVGRRGIPLLAFSTYTLMIEDLADVNIDAVVSGEGCTFVYYE